MEANNKKTILISGCAGFIGGAFCNWLIDNTEHTIIGIDNLSTGYYDNIPVNERFHFYFLSMSDENSINELFKYYKPSVCYHLAAYASEGRSNYIRLFIHQNNTAGTANIINLCVNHNCKLIFTGSVAVYSGQPPFTENTIPNPIDEYGLSKWTSEKSIQIAGEQQGLDWCIIRPRNVYGERQSLWDSTRNLFGIFCFNALNNKPLTIFGDGENKRSFTYIGDILNPLYKAIDISNEIINLGSANAYTIKRAAEIFSEVTGYKNIIHTEPRHEVKEAYCYTFKSQQLLAFEDFTGLHEGLKKMWQWAQEQPQRNIQKPPKLEITKNLHSSII